jgi:Flp pilus assembly protein TadG
VGFVVRLKRGDDGGAVAILVAVLATVLFGFAAIIVDLGYARTVEGDAQNAVDSASIAGAAILSRETNPSAPFSDATRAITTMAEQNFGTTAADWAGCVATKPSGSWVRGDIDTDCILFNHAVNPTKVQVVLPAKHVDSFFGGLVGYGGMDIGASAQATIRQDDVPGCAICVQGPLDTSGPVAINAVSPGGPVGSFSAGSGSNVRAGGSITVEDPGAITFEDTPNPAAGPSYSTPPIIRPVTDPLAGKAEPAGPGNFPDVWPTRTVTCGPGGDVTSLIAGVYRNIKVVGPCSATGVIVVNGPFIGLHITSDGSLSAVSAVIQFTCGRSRATPTICSGTAGGRLQIDPGGQLSMAASFPTEFSVVADPGNTASMTIDGELSVDQAIYGRLAAVDVGPSATVSAAGPISVNQLTVASGGAVNVNAPGAAPLPGPPFVGLYR